MFWAVLKSRPIFPYNLYKVNLYNNDNIYLNKYFFKEQNDFYRLINGVISVPQL